MTDPQEHLDALLESAIGQLMRAAHYAAAEAHDEGRAHALIRVALMAKQSRRRCVVDRLEAEKMQRARAA